MKDIAKPKEDIGTRGAILEQEELYRRSIACNTCRRRIKRKQQVDRAIRGANRAIRGEKRWQSHWRKQSELLEPLEEADRAIRARMPQKVYMHALTLLEVEDSYMCAFTLKEAANTHTHTHIYSFNTIGDKNLYIYASTLSERKGRVYI